MMLSRLFICLLLCGFACNGFALSDSTVTPRDLKHLAGCWKGSITYLDYSTNKPFSMPAHMLVKNAGKSNSLLYALEYPEETSANTTDSIVIAANGRVVNGEIVVKVTRFKDSTEIMTEGSGTDGNDNKPARFRHTYSIGRQTYSIKKEVLFDGQSSWILRHSYQFTRSTPAHGGK